MTGKSKWSSANDHLLGTMPDRKLADLLGFTAAVVTYQRALRLVPAYRPAARKWTADEDGRLGSESDAQIALELGRTETAVRLRRYLLNKPAHASDLPQPTQWPDGFVEALGKAPDHVVADRFGVSVTTVKSQRQKLGLVAVRSGPTRPVRSTTLLLTPDHIAAINALEPLLIDRYRAAGLPLQRLESRQIVEIALNELLASARKARTRQQYSGASGPGEERTP